MLLVLRWVRIATVAVAVPNRYLRDTVIRPVFDIHLRLAEEPVVLTRQPYPTLKAAAQEYLEARNLEAVTLDLGRWSDLVRGTVIVLLRRDGSGELTHLSEAGHAIRIGVEIETERVLRGYRGNRVTVNGFLMNLRKATKVFGGRRQVPSVYDVDVRGDRRVEYNVSRERIVGSGSTYVRSHLAETVVMGLKEMGYWEALGQWTRNLFTRSGPSVPTSSRTAIPLASAAGHRPPWSVEREEFLDRIADMIPRSPWPKGLHKDIAARLGISNGRANRAITYLISSGRVVAH